MCMFASASDDHTVRIWGAALSAQCEGPHTAQRHPGLADGPASTTADQDADDGSGPGHGGAGDDGGEGEGTGGTLKRSLDTVD